MQDGAGHGKRNRCPEARAQANVLKQCLFRVTARSNQPSRKSAKPYIIRLARRFTSRNDARLAGQFSAISDHGSSVSGVFPLPVACVLAGATAVECSHFRGRFRLATKRHSNERCPLLALSGHLRRWKRRPILKFQTATKPPSTSNSSPPTKLLSLDAKNRTALATSSVWASLPNGVACFIHSSAPSLARR